MSSDYYLKSSNRHSIEFFIKSHWKINKNNNYNKNTLLFAHEMYSPSFIDDDLKIFASRYNIIIQTGIAIKSKEGIVILNNYSASKDYISHLKKLRESWLNEILDTVFIKYKYVIDKDRLLERTKKEFHEIEIFDLCKELSDDEYYNYSKDHRDVNVVLNKLFVPLLKTIPTISTNLEEIHDNISDKTKIYFVNPSDLIINTFCNIIEKAIITPQFNYSHQFPYLCGEFRIEILIGSGSWI